MFAQPTLVHADAMHHALSAMLQALFCLGDLVWGHAQLQEHLAGQLAAPAAQQGTQGRGQQQPQPIPYLQVGQRFADNSLPAWQRAAR